MRRCNGQSIAFPVGARYSSLDGLRRRNDRPSHQPRARVAAICYGGWGPGVKLSCHVLKFAGEPGDLVLLGSCTLDGLNFRIDPLIKQLVDAGPAPAAVV